MVEGIVRPGTTPAQLAGIGVIIAGKIALPLLILVWPFAAGWANFVLDGIDGDLLVPLGLPNETYQPVDKLTDWLTYVCMVGAAYRAAWPIRRLVLALFLYRSIGQVAFLATGNELLLALFPNFLEPLFLVTATLLWWNRAVRHWPDWRARSFATLRRHRWAIGAGIVVYKLVDEWITHIGNIDRSDTANQVVQWFEQLLGR